MADILLAPIIFNIPTFVILYFGCYRREMKGLKPWGK